MKWRPGRVSELLECLAIEPLHLGEDLLGREQAIAMWKRLMQSPRFLSAVLTVPAAGGAEKIVGFGASVFVTAAFAASELSQPRPGLNSRLLASMVEGQSGVRTAASMTDTSAANALDLVILGGSFRPEGLSPEQVAAAQMLLPTSFAEQHAGYRLNRILMETVSEPQRLFHESSGVWRPIKLFPDERALIALTPETALSASGSVAAALFHYQEPVLGLRDADKHLLSEALDGTTDAVLARRLHLSLAAVKKRWTGIFERAGDARPGLLPGMENGGSGESRGPQKRHRILAYVRSHPEELRPYQGRPG